MILGFQELRSLSYHKDSPDHTLFASLWDEADRLLAAMHLLFVLLDIPVSNMGIYSRASSARY